MEENSLSFNLDRSLTLTGDQGSAKFINVPQTM